MNGEGPSIRALLLTFVVVATGDAAPASAQVFEAAVGGGYVMGGGPENPGPSLPSLNGMVAIWPWERWGVALRWVEGLGEDLYEVPVTGGDRTFLGRGHLRYWALTVRHRRRLPSDFSIELGVGNMFAGQFANIQMLHDPPRRLDAPDTFFSGFALEALVSRRLFRHLTIKAGATLDSNVETSNLQPLIAAGIRF